MAGRATPAGVKPERRTTHLSTVFAGQYVGIREVADRIWLASLLGGDDRMEQRRVHGGEHGQVNGLGQDVGGPGHRFQGRALIVGSPP